MVFFVDLAPQHCRRVAKAIPVVKKIIQPLGSRTIGLVENIFIKVAFVKLANIARLVDEINPRKARRVIGLAVKKGYLLSQLIARPQVVGVVHRDILAPRRGNGVANRDNRSAIFRVQKRLDSRVVEELYNIAAVVGRAVVDYQQFKIGERLIQNAQNRRTHVRRMIVARQYHADLGILFSFRQSHSPF